MYRHILQVYIIDRDILGVKGLIMENHMEKSMGHEMESRVVLGLYEL